MSFEDKLERFYSRLDLTGGNVIDVGAHTGRHAIPIAKLIGDKGVLLAFEPIPKIREVLGRNLQAANLNNVVIYPFALSRESRVAEFNFIPNLPEESGLQKRHIYNATPEAFVKIKVAVKRLDDLVPQDMKIDFIKMDVEGGELDVLEGGLGLLSGCKPVVAFECGAASFLGYHKTPEKIWEIFNMRGYAVYSITGDFMGSAEIFAKASYDQKYWDYLAFPPEKLQYHRLLN